MSRNIKQVAHDLEPSLTGISDLVTGLKISLPELFEKLKPMNPQLNEIFLDSLHTLEAVNGFAQYAVWYINQVNDEADKEGMEKRL